MIALALGARKRLAAGFGRCVQVLSGVVLATSLSVGLGTGAVQARPAPDSFADIAEQLSPAVVNISTSQTLERQSGDFQLPEFPPGSPFEDLFRDFLERGQDDGAPPRKVTSLGSGFVIDPSGIIVTNNHVIDKAEEISVTFADGRTLPAELIGHDPKTDIAVLRVKPDKPLAAVRFGNSDKSRVGDWVLAIGNPFGLGGSISAGIISARNRDINAGPYDDFIQTDAAINRGNSGGPLFNMDGEVVGVNTAIISPSGGSIGIGFAIPATMAQPVVAQLVQFGETRRGWLGVRIQTVTDEMAEALSLDKPKGALVAGVSEGGPAAKAGVLPGDVIVGFNGKDVPDMRALPRMVAETDIGKKVDLDIVRDGKKQSVRVEVGRLEDAEKVAAAEDETPKAATAKTGKESLGLNLAELTPEARSRYDIGPGVRGVLITAVDPKSSAAEKNIRVGDVIVEVAQEQVSKPDEVITKVDKVKASQKRSVLLLLNRQGELSFVAVRIG